MTERATATPGPFRMTQRADKVIGALVEGRRYLVPTVRGEWLDTHGVADWPVIGPRHKDLDLGVNVSHYHIDHRFVAVEEFNRDKNTVVNESSALPVSYKRWTCLQACVVLTLRDRRIMEMHQRFLGQQCEGSQGGGWICPHRGAWLGSHVAVAGVITCPAHGLRIDAATGRVVSWYSGLSRRLVAEDGVEPSRPPVMSRS